MKIWIGALIRASPKEGFEKLQKYFKGSRWFWKKHNLSLSFQRALLNTLSDFSSIDALEFLKKNRASISTELAHQVDTIIGNYRKGIS